MSLLDTSLRFFFCKWSQQTHNLILCVGWAKFPSLGGTLLGLSGDNFSHLVDSVLLQKPGLVETTPEMFAEGFVMVYIWMSAKNFMALSVGLWEGDCVMGLIADLLLED